MRWLLLLFFLNLNTFTHSHLNTVTSAPEVKVFICLGGTAYAYHYTRSCKGLAQCRHQIVQVTKDEAVQKYGRKACGYCRRTAIFE